MKDLVICRNTEKNKFYLGLQNLRYETKPSVKSVSSGGTLHSSAVGTAKWLPKVMGTAQDVPVFMKLGRCME